MTDDIFPTEEELAPEEKTGLLRMYENDILGGLLAAMSFREEAHPVDIIRGGAVCFTFRISPLYEEDYHACREKHTKFSRSNQTGIRLPESTDRAAYHNALIYRATISEDRERIWDNREAWRKADVLSGEQLIGRVLSAGEKNAVLELIDKISGYGTALEETSKN